MSDQVQSTKIATTLGWLAGNASHNQTNRLQVESSVVLLPYRCKYRARATDL